jgi:hypothetical protein
MSPNEARNQGLPHWWRPTPNDALLYKFMKSTNMMLPVAERRTRIGKVPRATSSSQPAFFLSLVPCKSLSTELHRLASLGPSLADPFHTLRINKSDLRAAATYVLSFQASYMRKLHKQSPDITVAHRLCSTLLLAASSLCPSFPWFNYEHQYYMH